MKGETSRTIQEFAEQLEPEIRAAFLQAIDDIRATAKMDKIIASIENNDVEGVLAALRLDNNFFSPLDLAISSAFLAGGRLLLDKLPKYHPASGARIVVRFQGRHPRAEQWIRESSSNLIREITDDQRTMIREILEQKIIHGVHSSKTALDIVGRVDKHAKRRLGGLIGLTNYESGHVETLRAALSDPETSNIWFSRKARDKRFDRSVARSIKNNYKLGEAVITRMVGRYADRLLILRGQRIARTESIRAFNAGRQEGLNQLAMSGEISPEHIRKEWVSVGDIRTRHHHREMIGQTVRYDQPFISPSGAALMFPGDTSLGAKGKDVINCRCFMRTVVNWVKT